MSFGSETEKVMGNRTVLKIGGTIYALAENFSYDEGYKEIVEHVPGTPTPIIGVGGFQGEFEADIIYTTDFPTTLMTLTSGDLPTPDVVFEETDAAALKKTHTLSDVRFFRLGNLVRKDAMVRARLRGVYGTPCVVT